MNTSSKELQLLERLFRSLGDDKKREQEPPLTDLFVLINTQAGEVSLHGDDDELINSIVLFSWVGEEQKPPSAAQRVALKQVVAKLSEEGYWESPHFARPFSIELVDDAFERIEELLFLDDEFITLTTPLLDGLDKELSTFIEDLLKS